MKVLMEVVIKGTRHGVVGGAALGVIWLHAGGGALAQEQAPQENEPG